MRAKFLTGSAIFLLMAATTVMVFVFREYRLARDASGSVYARSVKKRDIVDAARNAISALSDAEIREENYVLTGETMYSEAYADDIRTWQNEFGTLQLVAINDPASPLVRELSKAGTRTVSELASGLSLYDKGERDTVLERIRQGAAVVYLDQARNIVAMILELNGTGADSATPIISRSAYFRRRLAESAAVLFILAIIGIFLLILEIRHNQQSAGVE